MRSFKGSKGKVDGPNRKEQERLEKGFDVLLSGANQERVKNQHRRREILRAASVKLKNETRFRETLRGRKNWKKIPEIKIKTSDGTKLNVLNPVTEAHHGDMAETSLISPTFTEQSDYTASSASVEVKTFDNGVTIHPAMEIESVDGMLGKWNLVENPSKTESGLSRMNNQAHDFYPMSYLKSAPAAPFTCDNSELWDERRRSKSEQGEFFCEPLSEHVHENNKDFDIVYDRFYQEETPEPFESFIVSEDLQWESSNDDIENEVLQEDSSSRSATPPLERVKSPQFSSRANPKVLPNLSTCDSHEEFLSFSRKDLSVLRQSMRELQVGMTQEHHPGLHGDTSEDIQEDVISLQRIVQEEEGEPVLRSLTCRYSLCQEMLTQQTRKVRPLSAARVRPLSSDLVPRTSTQPADHKEFCSHRVTVVEMIQGKLAGFQVVENHKSGTNLQTESRCRSVSDRCFKQYDNDSDVSSSSETPRTGVLIDDTLLSSDEVDASDRKTTTNPPAANEDSSEGSILELLSAKVQLLDVSQQKYLLRVLDKLERAKVNGSLNLPSMFASLERPSMNFPLNSPETLGENKNFHMALRILSNWGDTSFVGLVEVDIFDSQGSKITLQPKDISLQGCPPSSLKLRETVPRLLNGIVKTTREKNMWLCPKPPTGDSPLEIHIQIPATDVVLGHLNIWNYNRSISDASKGVKELQVYIEGELIWQGMVTKGCGNRVFDYSTKISLREDTPLSATTSLTCVDTRTECREDHRCTLSGENDYLAHKKCPDRGSSRCNTSQTSSSFGSSFVLTSKTSPPVQHRTDVELNSQDTINMELQDSNDHCTQQSYVQKKEQGHVTEGMALSGTSKFERSNTNACTSGEVTTDIASISIPTWLEGTEAKQHPFVFYGAENSALGDSGECKNYCPDVMEDIAADYRFETQGFEKVKNSGQGDHQPTTINPDDAPSPDCSKLLCQSERKGVDVSPESSNDECFTRDGSSVISSKILERGNCKQVKDSWDSLLKFGANHNSYCETKISPPTCNPQYDSCFQSAWSVYPNSNGFELGPSIPQLLGDTMIFQFKDGEENLHNGGYNQTFASCEWPDQHVQWAETMSYVAGYDDHVNLEITNLPDSPILPAGQELIINILSTWGDPHYVGLVGIEMFDERGSLIYLHDPYRQIQADPPNINVLPGYQNDPRTVDKLVDNVNLTCDDYHVWLTPFTQGRPHLIRIALDSVVREIRKASGLLVDAAQHAEPILFTNDETILEAIELYDKRYHREIENVLAHDVTLKPLQRPDTSGFSGVFPSPRLNLKDMDFTTIDLAGAEDRPATHAVRSRSYFANGSTNKWTGERSHIAFEDYGAEESSNQQDGSLVGQTLTLHLLETWGDPHYAGLTSIEVLDPEGMPYAVPAEALCAKPRDLNDIPGCKGDHRTLDKLVDGCNVTTADHHMWLIPFEGAKNEHWLKIDLGMPLPIAALKLWNYNKNLDDTCRGVKWVRIYLDGNEVSPYGGHLVKKAPGNDKFDFGHVLPLQRPNNSDLMHLEKVRFREKAKRKRSNVDFIRQEYETPLLPCGLTIKLLLLSTWGDQHYMGLNGLEFYNELGQLLPLSFYNIHASPSSINDLPGVDDFRTLDKLFDGENNTWDDQHMWLTPYDPGKVNYIYVSFDEPCMLSLVRVWNYSKTPSRGVYEFELHMDDRIIYKGYLRQAPRVSSVKKAGEDFSQSLVFTNDEEVVQRHKEYVYFRGDIEHSDIVLINDKRIESTAKPSTFAAFDSLQRPATGLSCMTRS